MAERAAAEGVDYRDETVVREVSITADRVELTAERHGERLAFSADHGWLYALPFDHGVTSAGLVLRADSEAVDFEAARRDPAAAWRTLLEPYPSLSAQLPAARAVTPVRFVGRMQHRLERAAGRRWSLLPHTFAFYDPMFSTGIAWSLLAVERLALALTGEHGDGESYGRPLRREADRIGQLVEAAYLAMDDFELFAAVADLYFVTVSYTEARQRLIPERTPYAWEGFLGAGDPFFDELFADALERLRARNDGASFDRDAFGIHAARARSNRPRLLTDAQEGSSPPLSRAADFFLRAADFFLRAEEAAVVLQVLAAVGTWLATGIAGSWRPAMFS